MIKGSIEAKKLHLFSLGLSFQAGRDYVAHPYHKGKCYYPIFAVIILFAWWQITASLYTPPRIMLNRAQRRANHLK